MGSKRLLSGVFWLASLLLAEGAARLIFPAALAEFVPSENPRLVYELNPGYPGVNRFGMRQDDFDPSELRNRFVIAVIGDSHTYSSGSPNPAHAFPARLEYHLHERGVKDAVVLNFGVQGYDMVQELQVLQTRALRFSPNLIVLQYCINDDHIPNFIQPRFPALNQAMHKSVLLTTAWTTVLYSTFGRAHLIPLVDRAPDVLLFVPGLVGTPRSREQGTGHGFTHPTRDKDLVPARYREFVGRDNLEHAVQQFGDICLRERIPALATGFIERADEVVYERAGFQVYSFFTMFEGTDMRRYGYDPQVTDGHFQPQGNDFIGNALAKYITAHVGMTRTP